MSIPPSPILAVIWYEPIELPGARAMVCMDGRAHSTFVWLSAPADAENDVRGGGRVCGRRAPAQRKVTAGQSRALVVRRHADLAANLVEFAGLSEHPTWPLRQRKSAHGQHQERVALLNAARD